MHLALAYRPFIDPLDLHAAWYMLIVPLAFGIALTYKAIRVGDMTQYAKQVVVMSIQIVGAMGLLGLASYLLIQHVLPRILPLQ